MTEKRWAEVKYLLVKVRVPGYESEAKDGLNVEYGEENTLPEIILAEIPGIREKMLEEINNAIVRCGLGGKWEEEKKKVVDSILGVLGVRSE